MRKHDAVHRLVRDYIDQLAGDPAAHAEFLKLSFVEQMLERAAALGMSRSDIARDYGCSPQYLTKILAGTQNLTIETMARLAHVVGATVEVALVSCQTRKGAIIHGVPARTTETELPAPRRQGRKRIEVS